MQLPALPSTALHRHPRRFLPVLLRCLLALSAAAWPLTGFAQQQETGDSLSKFDKFNKKMERLFKIIPVPIYSHSTEAGDVFGLAKFNVLTLSKTDTVSSPSKLSEVATFSTLGRINVSVSYDLIWHEDRYMVTGFLNYRVQPEYILGIGNDVSVDDVEQIEISRFKIVDYFLTQFVPDFRVGIGVDLTIQDDVKADSTSFLYENQVTGTEGSTNFGVGAVAVYDNRDNRYNPMKGHMESLKTMFFPGFLGNDYKFSRIDVDLRKYFNPWFKHVIGIQATTSYRGGNVPFYELAMLGGDSKMRGYYEGALRDNVLVDGQVEYRMPVWNIFGITSWVGTGRVAESYGDLSFQDFWLSFGGGLRIMVDSEHQTNMRFDWGFGPQGVNGFYISFGEAF